MQIGDYVELANYLYFVLDPVVSDGFGVATMNLNRPLIAGVSEGNTVTTAYCKAREFSQAASFRCTAIRIARRGYRFNPGTWIEELQNPAQRAIRVVRTGIHVIHTGPCAVRVRMRRMVGPGAADRCPAGKRQRAFE